MMEFINFSSDAEQRNSNEKFSDSPLVFAVEPGQVIVGMSERGYCIFINTVFEGPVPAVREVSGSESGGSRGGGSACLPRSVRRRWRLWRRCYLGSTLSNLPGDLGGLISE